jgi:hypothetical protein
MRIVSVPSDPESEAQERHASDIYSVGRVIAWALTGENPQPNVALYPPPAPAPSGHLPNGAPADPAGARCSTWLRLVESHFRVADAWPVKK